MQVRFKFPRYSCDIDWLRLSDCLDLQLEAGVQQIQPLGQRMECTVLI